MHRENHPNFFILKLLIFSSFLLFQLKRMLRFCWRETTVGQICPALKAHNFAFLIINIKRMEQQVFDKYLEKVILIFDLYCKNS